MIKIQAQCLGAEFLLDDTIYSKDKVPVKAKNKYFLNSVNDYDITLDTYKLKYKNKAIHSNSTEFTVFVEYNDALLVKLSSAK